MGDYQTPPGDPLAQVKGPATFLMIVGGIGIVLQIIALLFNLLGAGLSAAGGGRGAMGGMMQGGIGAVFNVIAMVVGVVIFLGASKMQKLQNYNFAMAAAIIAMIPCISPCCLIGLPAGIWALVVLLKPEVKAAFTA
jgi:hypothetical protein